MKNESTKKAIGLGDQTDHGGEVTGTSDAIDMGK